MQLEAQNIGFRYQNGPWVLRGVDITLRPGEVVGLRAPSGRGKTTLAKILAGYMKPCEGVVQLNGCSLPASGYGPVQLIFQHPEKSINPRWRMGETLQEGWQPTEPTLAKLGIEKDWLNRWPNELSGGELQRFCVARALGPKTRYLIADEMTTMLDAITQAQIWRFVLEKVEQNSLGVLVISHEDALVKHLCHRVIELPPL